MREKALRAVTVVCLLAMACLTPAAQAQDGSAIDQYIEGGAPSAGQNPDGSAEVGGGGADVEDGGGTPAVPDSTVDELESRGTDGAATAALAQQTAPQISARSGEARNEPGTSPSAIASGSQADEADEGGLPAIGDLVGTAFGGSGSSGISAVLPLFLALALITVVALALSKARRSQASDEAD